jgi:hypothetical protein
MRFCSETVFSNHTIRTNEDILEFLGGLIATKGARRAIFFLFLYKNSRRGDKIIEDKLDFLVVVSFNILLVDDFLF